mgnify:CR=1 FL=1
MQAVPTELSRAMIVRLERDTGLTARLMAPGGGNVVAVDMTDGLRITFASSEILHLRPSGNAPELRCYTEADDEVRARALCDKCLAWLSSIVHELQ